MIRLAGLACLLAAAGSAGAQEATYLVRGDRLPVPVAVNGYVQTVSPTAARQVRIHVATTLSPVGSRGSYGTVVAQPVPPIPPQFRMPPALRSSLRVDRDAFDVATAVLQWVAVHLRVDDRDGPQDAATVLRTGVGRCSGVANATAALLMTAGFEAHTVSGLLMSAEGPMAHRWVECRLPGAGWVPTDPTLGLWVLTPRHIAFADTVRDIPEIVVEEESSPDLDRLPRWRGRPLRPNSGSELVCRLVGGGPKASAEAVLYGRDGEVYRAIMGPEARFERLLPGRWRLVVKAAGRVVEDRSLVLAANRLYTFNITLPPPAPGDVAEVGL